MTQGVVAPDFVPVFFADEQQAERFAVLFLTMFVVHLMRPAQGPHIAVVRPCKPFEALMNDDIVHQKVRDAIEQNAYADTYHHTSFIQPSMMQSQEGTA